MGRATRSRRGSERRGDRARRPARRDRERAAEDDRRGPLPHRGLPRYLGGGGASPASLAPGSGGADRRGPARTEGPVLLDGYPHRDVIEERTGVRLPGRAGVDLSLKADGVKAVTEGDTTWFGSADPALEVAAHEATHLLQHAGATRDQGLGPERHARFVAAGVEGGRSVGGLLGREGAPVPSAPRTYTEMTDAEQKAAGEWEVGSTARVGDEGRTVTTEFMRECWAESSLIASAEATLRSKGSGVSIKAGAGTITGRAPDGSGARTLHEVEAKISVSDPSTTNFYADCGRSSREVMGPTGADRRPKGVFTSDTGAETETGRSKNPADYRSEVFSGTGRLYTVTSGDSLSSIARKVLGDESRWKEIYEHGTNKALIGPDPSLIRAGQTLILPPGTAAEGRAHYLGLSASEREEFDRRHGINEYAAPGVGEAFTARRDDALSSAGFNFHWAGVIMEAGPDRVTFENFAKPGTDYDTKDEEWFFQTYGPASKPGQTFHEQNQDSVGEPGKNTMTFRARTQ